MSLNVHDNLSKGPHIILMYMRMSHKNFNFKIVHLVFILYFIDFEFTILFKYHKVNRWSYNLSNDQIPNLLFM